MGLTRCVGSNERSIVPPGNCFDGLPHGGRYVLTYKRNTTNGSDEVSDNKNEAIRLLKEISSKLTKLISLSDAQGHHTSGTLPETPTLDTVLEFARKNFLDLEISEIWFYSNDAVGWKHNGQPIVRWQSMLKAYAKKCARNDRGNEPEPEAKNNSKMDETIINEALRADWIKNNREKYIEAGCPCDLSELMKSD